MLLVKKRWWKSTSILQSIYNKISVKPFDKLESG